MLEVILNDRLGKKIRVKCKCAPTFVIADSSLASHCSLAGCTGQFHCYLLLNDRHLKSLVACWRSLHVHVLSMYWTAGTLNLDR